MRSLLGDLASPAVDAFLDAVDAVMNSNTFLLKVRAGARVTSGNRAETLSAFLRDPLFHDMMLAADRSRNWGNLQPAAPGGSSLVLHGVRPVVRDLGREGFEGRLRWMLQRAFSPYGRHLDDERAEAVLGPLPEALFGAAGAAPGQEEWSFCDVRPDFLRSTGYYTGEPCPESAYFDGGPSDTATFFYSGEVFHLLLTNGSP
ncbi:hypothetical protein [Nonomuraea sp. SBT364]|uniref:hypothetical protein n=1 Tax=Nonomuraea sp. SBT364 TaxID=1580530 RepID=UPI00066C4469|nr:hypothetical protein [Nonomuraea sp. SBT364]